MCDKYPIIPQEKGTCWFNVIITACCYSQELRKIVEMSSITWDKNNSFYKYMKMILKYAYSKDKNIQELFIKQKIEFLLFKYLNFFDKKLKKTMQLIFKYFLQNPYYLIGFTNYISKFIKNLNINSLDIIIIDNNYIVDFNKNMHIDIRLKKEKFKDFVLKIKKKIIKADLTKIPDVIIIEPDNTNKELLKYKTKNFNININKDFIEYKGHIYKLDACILRNYNKLSMVGHVILGFTCNNNKYIYNSENINKNYCKFYKFDWDISKEKNFSFDYINCKINYKVNEEKEQCFSFNKGIRTLIYVRIDNDYLSISKKDTMIKDFYDTSNISKLNLQKILKNLNEPYENKTKKELIELLNNKIKYQQT